MAYRKIWKRKSTSLMKPRIQYNMQNVSPSSHLFEYLKFCGIGVPRFGADSSMAHQTSCVVCMCDFGEDELIEVLPCLHQFHAECLDTWLEVSLCRLLLCVCHTFTSVDLQSPISNVKNWSLKQFCLFYIWVWNFVSLCRKTWTVGICQKILLGIWHPVDMRLHAY